MFNLIHLQLESMIRARDAYKAWHSSIVGSVEDLLALNGEKIKAFCADLAKAGYAANTILQLYLSGLCTWVSFNAIFSNH